MTSQEYEALIMDSEGPVLLTFTTREISETMEEQVRKQYTPVEKIEKVDQGYEVTRKSGGIEFYDFGSAIKALRNLDKVLKQVEEE